jgi:hypothetical protein
MTRLRKMMLDELGRRKALEDWKVSFRWHDSAYGNKLRVMTLPAEEFVRRFFLHVLSPAFVRIGHFGIFSNRLRKVALDACRTLLGKPGAVTSFWLCPDCGGVMVLVERLTPAQTYMRPSPVSRVSA